MTFKPNMKRFFVPHAEPETVPAAKSWYRISARADETEIYIFDEIGIWGITADQFVRDLAGVTSPSVLLRINSIGGDVFDGTAIYNALLNHPATITARIEGLAASMASVIALAANRVEIAETAYYMIHNPWTFVIGTAADLRHAANVVEKVEVTIRGIYQAKTGLDANEVQALMNDETYYVGTEAVEAKFADTLVETQQQSSAAQSATLISDGNRHAPASPSEIANNTFVATGTSTFSQSWARRRMRGAIAARDL